MKRSKCGCTPYFLLEHLFTGAGIRKGDGTEKVTPVLLYELSLVS